MVPIPPWAESQLPGGSLKVVNTVRRDRPRCAIIQAQIATSAGIPTRLKSQPRANLKSARISSQYRSAQPYLYTFTNAT